MIKTKSDDQRLEDDFLFTKWEGLQNDFILCDLRQNKEIDSRVKWSLQAEAWCHRRLGIGADGLVLIRDDAVLDASFQIFNADGSEAQMCGNALRCAIAYLDQPRRLTLKTLAGARWGEVVPDSPKRVKALVGQASWLDPQLYVEFVDGEAKTISAVSVGNPHAVLFDWEEDWKKDASYYSQPGSWLAEGVNIEFATVINREKISLEVMERGVGWSQACGTGAAATVWAGYHRGILAERVHVIMPGGELLIELDGDDVIMEGSARKVFQGKAPIERGFLKTGCEGKQT